MRVVDHMYSGEDETYRIEVVDDNGYRFCPQKRASSEAPYEDILKRTSEDSPRPTLQSLFDAIRMVEIDQETKSAGQPGTGTGDRASAD